MVLDGWEGAVNIGGRRIANLRYADDTVLLAGSEKELQEIVNRLDRVGNEKELLINMDNTKTMILNGKICNIMLHHATICYAYWNSIMLNKSS